MQCSDRASFADALPVKARGEISRAQADASVGREPTLRLRKDGGRRTRRRTSSEATPCVRYGKGRENIPFAWDQAFAPPRR